MRQTCWTPINNQWLHHRLLIWRPYRALIFYIFSKSVLQRLHNHYYLLSYSQSLRPLGRSLYWYCTFNERSRDLHFNIELIFDNALYQYCGAISTLLLFTIQTLDFYKEGMITDDIHPDVQIQGNI